MYDFALVLHGCPKDTSQIIPAENRWMNWLAQELTKRGLPAQAPDLPIPWAPEYESWKSLVETFPITDHSLLVGHSCSAAFLVRWLTDTGKRVKKLILVAPAKIPEFDGDIRGKLYEFSFPANPRDIADDIVIFTSDDFPHHLASLALYTKALQPRVKKLEAKGHFLFFQMGTREFPEILGEALA